MATQKLLKCPGNGKSRRSTVAVSVFLVVLMLIPMVAWADVSKYTLWKNTSPNRCVGGSAHQEQLSNTRVHSFGSTTAYAWTTWNNTDCTKVYLPAGHIAGRLRLWRWSWAADEWRVCAYTNWAYSQEHLTNRINFHAVEPIGNCGTGYYLTQGIHAVWDGGDWDVRWHYTNYEYYNNSSQTVQSASSEPAGLPSGDGGLGDSVLSLQVPPPSVLEPSYEPLAPGLGEEELVVTYVPGPAALPEARS